MRRATLLLLIGLLDAAAQARAVGTSGEARFPATVSDATLGEFLRVGRVEAAIPRDADAWLRWGGAPVEHQASAVRAVVDALSTARPRISLAAAILTIARVESGWNPTPGIRVPRRAGSSSSSGPRGTATTTRRTAASIRNATPPPA
jgi:hypothetical protein